MFVCLFSVKLLFFNCVLYINETKLYFTHYHSITSIIEKEINRFCALT